MNKYRAKGFRDADGTWWASRGEYCRWHDLVMLERAGQITKLERQVILDLHAAGGKRIGKYVADFYYIENGHECWEDFKGIPTPLSSWKCRHVEAEYGIKILLTGAASRKRAA